MTAPRKRSPDTRGGDRHRRKPRAIRLPDDVEAAVVALAEKEKRPVRAVILEAVRRHVGLGLDGGSATD